MFKVGGFAAVLCFVGLSSSIGLSSPLTLISHEVALCLGLLCDLTPNSMSRPVTIGDAIRLQQAALAKTRPASPTARLLDRHKMFRSNVERHHPLIVHLVVGSQITSLKQLSGQLVSFPPNDAPGQTAAKRVFREFGVRVQQTALDLDNALDGVSTGDVGAVAIVSDGDLQKVRDLSAPNLQIVSLLKDARPSRHESALLEARR